MGYKAGTACCISAVLLPLALIIIGEVFIPEVITSKLHDKIVHDTPEEIAEWCGDGKWAPNVTITLTVFNLTNGKALQSVTPAPKPHFEAIEVEFTQMGKSFGCSSLDGGEKIKYHDWSKWVPTDPDMYDFKFVQVNPAYLGTIGALAPSESMLLVGLSHHILGTVATAMSQFGTGVVAVKSAAELAGMGQMLGENLSSAAAVGQVQFGSSGLTNLMAAAQLGRLPSQVGFTSVAADPRFQAKGVCTPVELGAFMNDLSAGPFAPDSPLAELLQANGFEFASFGMSAAESEKFLALFTNQFVPPPQPAPNWAAVIGKLAQQYAAFMKTGDLTNAGAVELQLFSQTTAPGVLFKDTYGTLSLKHLPTNSTMSGCSSSAGGNFCALVAAAYAKYLTSYLPEKLFVGCNLLGCADGSCMRDDGTYPLNSGLFTRLTLREMLHDGNSDKLFAMAPKEAVPEGVTLEYNGLLGKYAHMNATLEELLENEKDLTKFSSVQLSGKTDITRVREWVEFQGMTVVESNDSAYPGWGNDGTPGKPFDFSGMHYLNNQAPQTKKNSPIAMSRRNHKSTPNFGSGIDFHLTTVKMPVTLGCGLHGDTTSSDCEFTQVKGIQTQKFTVPDSLLKTKKGGAIESSCRGSVSKKLAKFIGSEQAGPTCDYLARHDGVINMAVARGGAPLAVTHGYLGQTDAAVRNAVSITLPNSAEELHYEAAKDELALFVEPITGSVITGYERLQTNWYIERSFMDTARYANVFSADSDNNDVFVWPFMYIKKEPAITDSGASNFKKVIYGAYDNGFHLSMLGVIMCLICAISAGICCKVDTGKAFGRLTGEPQAEASV